MRTCYTGEDGARDGGNVGTGHAALGQVQILTDDRDELPCSTRPHFRPLDRRGRTFSEGSRWRHSPIREGGMERTGAAANVDMKLVKKHSQLMWKDLRCTGGQQ